MAINPDALATGFEEHTSTFSQETKALNHVRIVVMDILVCVLCLCKERSQPVGTDSSRHNIIISTPNTNQWSLFIVTLQTTLMDRQSAHQTRVQRLLTCAVTDYYTTPSSRRSVSIGWSSCSLGIPVLYFCRLISMGSLIFCRFFMW